jgi:hypothetical protein
LLQRADAPALVRSYEALREATNRTLQDAANASTFPETRDTLTSANETLAQVQASLTALDSRQERALHALQLLLEHTGTQAGYLFLFDEGGPFVAATLGRKAANEALLASVQDYLQAELCETKTAVVTSADVTTDTAARSGLLSDGDGSLVPLLLSDATAGRSQLAGLALFLLGDRPVRLPHGELVRAVARCLFASGDTLRQLSDDA